MKHHSVSKSSLKKQSMAVTIISVLLFLLVLVVFAIQLSIIISYFITMNFGRCVYLSDSKDDDSKTCYCDYTTKAVCDKANGIYNEQLNCDNFAKDCHKPN